MSDIHYRPYIYGFQAFLLGNFHHIAIAVTLTSVNRYIAWCCFFTTLYMVAVCYILCVSVTSKIARKNEQILPKKWRKDGDSNPGDPVKSLHTFQACQFNHSCILPYLVIVSLCIPRHGHGCPHLMQLPIIEADVKEKVTNRY